MGESVLCLKINDKVRFDRNFSVFFPRNVRQACQISGENCYGFTIAAVVDQSHVCIFLMFLLTGWMSAAMASNTSLDRECFLLEVNIFAR